MARPQNVFDSYRKLNGWGRLAVWGSVASIMSVLGYQLLAAGQVGKQEAPITATIAPTVAQNPIIIVSSQNLDPVRGRAEPTLQVSVTNGGNASKDHPASAHLATSWAMMTVIRRAGAVRCPTLTWRNVRDGAC